MNDQLIEKILSKVPIPKAPAELEDMLLAGIRLERSEIRHADRSSPPSWLRRWLPGLSFAVLAVACLGIVGTQMAQLADLRRGNGDLRIHNQDLASLREANAEVLRLRGENAELNRLQASGVEIQRLRNEAGQLRFQVGDLAQLRAENKRLKATPAARLKPDFFEEPQWQAERISCVNNLKLLGTAIRIWEGHNNGRLPPDFASMTNEMESWKISRCPGDKSRGITNWDPVMRGDVSYKMFTAGLTENDNPSIIVFECPVHHNIGLLDGSVQQMSEESMTNHVMLDANGRRIFIPYSQ